MTLPNASGQLANAAIDAISHCSVPRAVWHLSAAERWRAVRDTLLGHAPIRGGLRPRDLPIDGDFRDMLAAIAALHNLIQPQNCDPVQQYRFGDWLYSFAALLESDPLQQEPGELPIPHQALHACFLQMRRAFGAPEEGDFSKHCPFLHRLIGSVGWSMKDWNHLQRASDKRVAWLADTARLAARIAMASPETAEIIRRAGPDTLLGEVERIFKFGGSKRPQLARLAQENLRVLTLMTEHVQDYIGRGQRHWLMRGASAWCSQVLAWARDEIPLHLPGALLLSDSDVLVAFLMPTNATQDAEAVMNCLWTAWRSKDHFLQRFPRLYECAAVSSATDLDPRTALPDLSIRISSPKSLLALCLAETPRNDKEHDEIEPGGSAATRGIGDLALAPVVVPCANVADDEMLTEDPPPWLEVRGNNQGGKVTERFGFTSLVWSLCGTTLRTHWFQNVAGATRTIMPAMRMMPVHHGEWLKHLHVPDDPLTFLKLDGDKVGRSFRCSPVSRRPYLSMELGRLVLKRVMAATCAVTRQRSATACEPYLPVDLVYLGGDDVFVCLPLSSVATFLAGFCKPLADDHPDAWRGLRFSYCCVSLPSGSVLDPKSEAMQAANLLASHLCTDILSDVVKPDKPEELSSFDVRSRTHGFFCERWLPPLIVHGGDIDQRLIRGLHLRLVPTSETLAAAGAHRGAPDGPGPSA